MICVIGIMLIPQVYALDPLERVPIEFPRLVNAFNSPVSENVNVNQQVQIASEVTNKQGTIQDFVYIVQIRNEDNIIVSLGWSTGTLQPSQTFSQARSWTPDLPGTYTADIFVWKSFIEPEALSEGKTIKITVS
ncbi:hypothetical protein C6988_06575 [Nitrosopumilus sp. b1]|nr:hypothetical protein C6988_06575 [Nitrosopumilus sp. b1]